MRRHDTHLLAVVLAMALALAGAALGSVAPAAAQPSATGAAARAEHQRVVDYWTPERMATARPRDYVRDPATDRFELAPSQDSPPGSQRTVLAAPWTGGGLVERTTGKAFFFLSGQAGTCSASVVEDSATGTSLLLTAAHCVYDNENEAFADFWLFVPDFEAPLFSRFCADARYGCWVAEGITVPRAYADQDTFNDTAAMNDVAFVTVGSGFPDGSLLDAKVGAQEISFTPQEQRTRADLFGYPTTRTYSGFTMVHSAGRLQFDARKGKLTYRVPSQMAEGISGGPWYAGFDAGTGTGVTMSVTSYAYRPQAALYGPIFTEQTAALYAAADGAQGNQVVP